MTKLIFENAVAGRSEAAHLYSVAAFDRPAPLTCPLDLAKTLAGRGRSVGLRTMHWPILSRYEDNSSFLRPEAGIRLSSPNLWSCL